ncbi:MAG: hypothetical protein WC875_04465 [Candidatus Absconditabacterales bacterium]
MHTNEQKIIKLSMMVLSLAIILVYVLLFQVKGKTLKGNTPSTTTSGGDIVISIQSGDEQQTLTPTYMGRQEIPDLPTTSGTISGLDDGKIILPTGATVLPTIETPQEQTGGINILSGTNVFYGSIESIDKLGIKYQYALIDNKNTYYIYLGNPTYDFASIARKLNGNLYELKTEQEIAQNQLFGDKIVFINLPEYKDKKVVMLVYLGKDIWLLQIEYANYYKAKKYLKPLFTQ